MNHKRLNRKILALAVAGSIGVGTTYALAMSGFLVASIIALIIFVGAAGFHVAMQQLKTAYQRGYHHGLNDVNDSFAKYLTEKPNTHVNNFPVGKV